MPNLSKPFLTPERRLFIDDLAAMLAPWGMAPAMGSLYGYLLLSSEPVSLDDIAADLDIAKSSASVAARLLERHRLARRYPERGSRRVRYGPSECQAGFIIAQAALLGDLATMVHKRAHKVAKGDALDRLQDLAAFYASMQGAIESGLKTVKTKKATSRRRQ